MTVGHPQRMAYFIPQNEKWTFNFQLFRQTLSLGHHQLDSKAKKYDPCNFIENGPGTI